MEAFFNFLGIYWWLAFPLMGVAGGAFARWERYSKRRHKRRLEVLHVIPDESANDNGVF